MANSRIEELNKVIAIKKKEFSELQLQIQLAQNKFREMENKLARTGMDIEKLMAKKEEWTNFINKEAK